MKMGVVLTQRLERSGRLLSSFCGETSFYFLEIKYMCKTKPRIFGIKKM